MKLTKYDKTLICTGYSLTIENGTRIFICVLEEPVSTIILPPVVEKTPLYVWNAPFPIGPEEETFMYSVFWVSFLFQQVKKIVHRRSVVKLLTPSTQNPDTIRKFHDAQNTLQLIFAYLGFNTNVGENEYVWFRNPRDQIPGHPTWLDIGLENQLWEALQSVPNYTHGLLPDSPIAFRDLDALSNLVKDLYQKLYEPQWSDTMIHTFMCSETTQQVLPDLVGMIRVATGVDPINNLAAPVEGVFTPRSILNSLINIHVSIGEQNIEQTGFQMLELVIQEADRVIQSAANDLRQNPLIRLVEQAENRPVTDVAQLRNFDLEVYLRQHPQVLVSLVRSIRTFDRDAEISTADLLQTEYLVRGRLITVLSQSPPPQNIRAEASQLFFSPNVFFPLIFVWGSTQVGPRLERRSREGMASRRSQRQRRNLDHLRPPPYVSLGTRTNRPAIEENREDRGGPRDRDRFVFPVPVVLSVGDRIHEFKEFCTDVVRCFVDWFENVVRRD